MRPPRHLTHDRDSGFTLIEFIVAMIITAIAATAVAGSIIIGFRTVGATADEIAQSHDAQTLSFWLLPDLQSLGPGSTIDTTHPAGPSPSYCTGSLPAGTYIVNLTWTDYQSIHYQSDYITATDASGQKVLERYYCSSASPTPTLLTLVYHVSSAAGSVTFCDSATTPSCALPTMQVTTLGPAGQVYTFSVSGNGR